MRTPRFVLVVMMVVLSTAVANTLATTTIDFESLPLAGGATYENGANLSGGFAAGGAWFGNTFEDYGSYTYWEGFAYSQETDTTTPGFLNQYSAYPGSGAGGSMTYGVAYSAIDSGYGGLASVHLPAGARPTTVAVANTTYAALSMLDGDTFTDPIGGITGTEPDWFLLTVEGHSATGELLGQVQTYLADYRFENSQDDYVLDGWVDVDLAPLRQPGLARLDFRLSGTIENEFGFATPAYVAVDNLTFEPPMPGDYNGDQQVDLADYTVWRNQLGTSVTAGFGADGSGDGVVDAVDFGVWKQHFGAAGVANNLTRTVVPEPSAGWLVLVGIGGIGLIRSKHRGRV